MQAQPGYGRALCVLGLIDAALERKKEALSEGLRAIELLPVKKDSTDGSQMLVYFAIIAAWVGEKDTAFAILGGQRPITRRTLHCDLRRIKAAALLGPTSRRSVLRENRCLFSAKKTVKLNHAVLRKGATLVGNLKDWGSSLSISAKPAGVGAASQRLIPTGERSGLQTHIATMESVSLCTRMKS